MSLSPTQPSPPSGNRPASGSRDETLEERIGLLTAELHELNHKVDELLVSRKRDGIVPIQSLTPEPLRLSQPIYATVRASGDSFIASFADANVNASGDTRSEAVLNLKELIIDLYLDLNEEPPEALGPHPARQLAVLREFIADLSQRPTRHELSDSPRFEEGCRA